MFFIFINSDICLFILYFEVFRVSATRFLSISPFQAWVEAEDPNFEYTPADVEGADDLDFLNWLLEMADDHDDVFVKGQDIRKICPRIGPLV